LLVREYLSVYPYNGGLGDLASHLWTSKNVRACDLLIFAFIALYAYFTYIHVAGALSWLKLFSEVR